jgi:HEAT repeat protein
MSEAVSGACFWGICGHNSLRMSLNEKWQTLKTAALRQAGRATFILGDEQAQIEAIQLLGKNKDPKSVPMLLNALGSNHHPTVRTAAALALGEIRDPAATLALVGLLEEETEMLQKAATTALGNLGDERAMLMVVSFLKHPAEEFRKLAAETAVKLGPKAVAWIAELLKRSSFETRIAAAYALGLIRHEKCFAALETVLGDADSAVRREVANSIAAQGRACTARLLAHLDSTSALVRQTAALSLLKLHDSASLESLRTHLLAEEDADIREILWAILAACLWQPAVQRHLAKELIAKREFQKAVAFGSVAADPAIEFFRNGDIEDRKHAEELLGDLGTAATGRLVAVLMDADYEVRRLAARVLKRNGWQPADEIESVRFKIAAGHFATITESAAVPFLIRLLSDANANERELAAEAFGSIRGESVLEGLAQAARHGDSRVRIKTAMALANFSFPAARDILNELAHDSALAVAAAAKSTLRKLEQPGKG